MSRLEKVVGGWAAGGDPTITLPGTPAKWNLNKTRKKTQHRLNGEREKTGSGEWREGVEERRRVEVVAVEEVEGKEGKVLTRLWIMSPLQDGFSLELQRRKVEVSKGR